MKIGKKFSAAPPLDRLKAQLLLPNHSEPVWYSARSQAESARDYGNNNEEETNTELTSQQSQNFDRLRSQYSQKKIGHMDSMNMSMTESVFDHNQIVEINAIEGRIKQLRNENGKLKR